MRAEYIIYVTTLLVGLFGGINFGKAYLDGYHKITTRLEQCEAELPRKQKCVLVAVPEEK